MQTVTLLAVISGLVLLPPAALTDVVLMADDALFPGESSQTVAARAALAVREAVASRTPAAPRAPRPESTTHQGFSSPSASPPVGVVSVATSPATLTTPTGPRPSPSGARS